MISELEKYIYAKLDEMQTEKAKQPIHPKLVNKAEFFASVDKDIRKVLNKMFVEKRLKVHPTKDAPINDFIELIKEEEK